MMMTRLFRLAAVEGIHRRGIDGSGKTQRLILIIYFIPGPRRPMLKCYYGTFKDILLRLWMIMVFFTGDSPDGGYG